VATEAVIKTSVSVATRPKFWAMQLLGYQRAEAPGSARGNIDKSRQMVWSWLGDGSEWESVVLTHQKPTRMGWSRYRGLGQWQRTPMPYQRKRNHQSHCNPILGAAYAGSCPQLRGLFSESRAAVNQAWLADAATETRSGGASELTCELPANLNKEAQRPGALCKKPAFYNHAKQPSSNQKERTRFGNGGVDASVVCPHS